jgi:hypothetical protein
MKTSKNNHVFIMRLDFDTKQKMETLSSNQKYKYNLSALVRDLIKLEHQKLLNNEK